jgi:hydroxypyruvate reductase
MVSALLADRSITIRQAMASATHRGDSSVPDVEWFAAAHPLPDATSVAAGGRALAIAHAVPPGETLLLLLSGGASALLALPLDEVTLADKRRTIELLMHQGGDIHTLNAVRKHLSAIKGGRLAAACQGTTVTLAVSDVIGDDLSVIGSGPGVADRSTWAEAAEAIERFGGEQHPASVRTLFAEASRGARPDTPKPGEARLARAHGLVIAGRDDALRGAQDAAERLGYHVIVFPDPIAGEARIASQIWFDRVLVAARETPRPLCILSAGETTVRVEGSGRGGRNQEFALALAAAVAQQGDEMVVASIGTDGIDGPTDAAGALVDQRTIARSVELGLGSVGAYLRNNDAHGFFAPLDDLIHLGRTDTNVGDVQICLII